MPAPALHREPIDKSLLAQLHQLLGDRLSTATAVCDHHGKDESYHAPHSPDAVAFAHSTEEVSAIVKLCSDHKTPVIAFGTGTSLEGQVAALAGGVCIDLSQMNQVLRVNVEDLDAVVQAGVTRKQLNEYLRDTGLFFRSIQEPMRHSAAWPRRAPREPTRYATEPCARTYSR